jgi:hypothetical protein
MTNKNGAWRTESDGAEDADGEEEDGGDEGEDSGDRDADDAEGQSDKPHDGIKDEREQGKRPAEHEKNAKEKELDHGSPFGRGIVPNATVKRRIRG